MQRRSFILRWRLLLALVPCASPAYQPQQIDLSVATPLPVRVLPGQIATLSFGSHNRTSQNQAVTPVIVLPEGWRSFTRHQTLSLKPNESNSWISTFRIPANSQAGSYQVVVRLVDPAQTTILAEIVVPITVDRVMRIDLKHVSSPRFVSAGSRYVSEFLVSNDGNAEIDVKLRASGMTGFPTGVAPSSIRLKPQESKPIRVEVATPDTLQSSIRFIVELIAMNAADTTKKASSASSVDIIPSVSADEIPYHRLPMNFTLRGVSQKSRYGAQLELLGDGSLSDRRSDRLAFRFRGPNIQRASFLGQYDEYRIAYKTSGLDMRVGDHPYLLTPLTEYGRYASGVGGSVDILSFTLGGFYNRTRWAEPTQREHAGFLKYNLSEESSIAINYLGKRENTNVDLGTIRGLLKPWSKTVVDLEYGTGQRGSRKDDGYSARVSAQQSWMNVDMWYFRVGPQYGGYYRDMDHKSATVNIYPISTLRLEASYREESRNLLKDTMQFSAPRDRFMQFGAAYGSYAALVYRQSAQKDLLPGRKADNKEDLVQLRLGYSFDRLSLTTFGEVGRLHDDILGRSQPFHRAYASINIRPMTGHSYSLSSDYFKGRNIFTEEEQERISLNLSVWMLLGHSTFLGTNVNANRIVEEFGYTNVQADISLEQNIFAGHRIAVRGRFNWFSPRIIENESALLLEYGIPINFPISRVGATGQLRGRITHAVTNSGVRNALILVGRTSALTDATGHYNFPALVPGAYYVTVDRSSIGLNRVTTVPVPVAVSVSGGKEEFVDIGVVESATVEGTIIQYTRPETFDTTRTQLSLVGGHAGAVLELKSDHETFRRVSDNRGRFLFTDLRPGNYSLSVVEGNLPEFTVFEKDHFDVTVAPDQTFQVQLKIIPRRRTIRIVDSGELIQRPGRPVARVTQPERRTEIPVVVETAPPSRPAPVEAIHSLEPATPSVPAVADPTLCQIFPSADGVGFTLQLSSWRTRAHAERQASEAGRKSGYQSRVEHASIPGRGMWYRVQLLNLRTEELAAEMCLKLLGAPSPEPKLALAAPVVEAPPPRPTPVEETRSVVPATPSSPTMVDPTLCQIFPSADGVGFTLQISSWRTRAHAEEQALETERMSGYRSWIERASIPSSGTWYRVQLLNLRTKELAAEICMKLHGAPPPEPKPVSTVPVVEAPPPLKPAPAIEIQVSSWTSSVKAERIASEIRKIFGYSASVVEVRISGLGIRYRVVLSGFTTQSEAQIAAQQVQAHYR